MNTMKNEHLLRNKLDEINTILVNHQYENMDLGVLTGSAGIALFHFYYSRFSQEEISADLGSMVIADIIQKINEGYDMPSFCTGISGAAWVIELLLEEEYIELNADSLLAILDDYLIEFLAIDPHENFYDFLHGVLGIGFYYLKRYERTQNLQLKEKYRQVLLDITRLLDNTATKDQCGLKWESYLIRSTGLRGYNLGLSHGISSIINFLSRLVKFDDFKTEGFPLLQGATSFLMSCRNETGSTSTSFPDWIVENSSIDQSSRLAWCYGDLGIGITLWRASEALNDAVIAKVAIDTLVHASKRKNLHEARVMDAGLCHGAFGIMHIYNQMHEKTAHPIFKETAEYWKEQALDMAIHEDGLAGYQQWRGDGKEQWRKETNLLEGIAGIGLSIMTYLSPSMNKWDQCLLIN
ncbi:lanthionine synthetase C family protein [Spongiimicrobium salis]|uniref:lanthionine synthetase C family protein n=1 Tax=Spongiimicrobium salis TaxID=1667022 RepID=UPI00374D6CDB